ncbi:class I SAM-dependent methyltransferase [Umezawaea endophytica]|uniref:Class I SAM-dependent methyltransferase n=1 Tax=Umezawaea endophytica TaxID=1654476 RepID=A0A9X3AEH6_9PSEU|nr:class I SAM-dependent methyltransferase [Umezawaea endophytica]MCS7477287.1 class I SAM-dependent methyltransferase [Umezawaea endophytica]
MTTFEDLIEEGEAVPTAGWDFGWFEGRATEERPSWGYSRLLAEHMADAEAALDLQTGGAEVLAGIPSAPKTLCATESWPPNLEIARRNLAPLGGTVVEVQDTDDLPFDDGSFDLVVSRHPTTVLWHEIARVLKPGGTYLSQGIGSGTNRELSEAFLGPLPAPEDLGIEADADAAGLSIITLQHQSLRAEYYDIGAIVHFLRKVLWTVPGFTVDRYRPQLAALHQRIVEEGPFVSHARRYLLKAEKRVPVHHP